MERKHLQKIGFTSDIAELDVIAAECFIVISREIDKIEAEKMEERKRNAKVSKPRHRR